MAGGGWVAGPTRKIRRLRAVWRMGVIKRKMYKDLAWFLLPVMIIPHILALTSTWNERYIDAQFEFSAQG